jgi:hypothetical protein
MSKLKLKPKQAAMLNEIQTKKAELQKVFAELTNKESMILELIFEAEDIHPPINNVKLEGDLLEYEVEEETKPVKKTKEAKLKP